jgi:GcrA cell cycle regulator
MAWTEERVARLTKLWQDGLSASQIAADLGGVTRNAVIGKVHRLGMSGRDKAPGTGGKAASKAAPAGTTSINSGKTAQSRTKPAGQATSARGGSSATYTRPQRNTAGGSVGNAALKMELEEDAVEEAQTAEAIEEAVDNVVPISRKLDLLQLTESTCKWPTGDPTMPGFSFCGHTSAEDKPYCEFHSKLAFQPPNERRRRR